MSESPIPLAPSPAPLSPPSAGHVFIVADDRTGAIETAGMCADGLGEVVTVSVLGGPLDVPSGHARQRVWVIDVQSRHLPSNEVDAVIAAAHDMQRAYDVSVAREMPARHAHKVDSLLRGNWAAEVVVRAVVTGQRAIVVAAFPALGRVCRGGRVYADGRPLSDLEAQSDIRSAVIDDRPERHLSAAGAIGIAHLRDISEVRQWLASGDERFAVCDAVSDPDVDAIGAAWATSSGVLLAGTARAVAAGVVAAGVAAGRATSRWRPPVPLPGPVLVVCGSAHDAARTQIDVASERGAATVFVVSVDAAAPLPPAAVAELAAGRNVVLCAPEPVRRPVPDADAERMAAVLARATHDVLGAVRIGSLVVLGGDTAAAVLGANEVGVGGTVAVGTPWMHAGMPTVAAQTGDMLVVTRAGGFGNPHALADLLPLPPAGRLGT